MTIDDLTTTARLWIEDHRLPEPDSMKLGRSTGRIELNYDKLDPLPEIGWGPSRNGMYLIHESDVGGVDVSVYVRKAVAA